jgi:dTDP-4-dehydrorhamnose 3,5-epimerase
MLFDKTDLAGVFLIRPEPVEDERGFFARTWCQRELEDHGLVSRLAQCSVSYNRRKGTLRGMHYQIAPHEEEKVVRCTQGALWDVVVDLRPSSPTFRQWVGYELSARNRAQLYIPAGCAHGFQTLQADTEAFYMISEFYHPEHARGVRWDDPAFGIQWPATDQRIISDRDRGYPDFAE